MRKDRIRENSFCQDCEDENCLSEGVVPNDDTLNNGDECCCCCCSCCATEPDPVEIPHPRNLIQSIEDQKKDLMSHLSFVQTNQNPVTIQHLLQFIEFFCHSKNFLRQYNLQDLCLECLLSDMCDENCINGLSNLTLNDRTDNTCECCEGTATSQPQLVANDCCQGCPADSRPISSKRSRSHNRRGRRRRQRHSYNDSSRNFARRSSRAVSTSEFERNPEVCDSGCAECHPESRNCGDSCEECARETTCCMEDSNLYGKIRRLPSRRSEHDSFCEECSRESTSTYRCPCNDCRNDGKETACGGKDTCSESSGLEGCPCDCKSEQNLTNTDKSLEKPKKRKTSESSKEKQSNQVQPPTNFDRCDCSDCRAASEGSEESCDECSCKSHSDKSNRKKKK